MDFEKKIKEQYQLDFVIKVSPKQAKRITKKLTKKCDHGKKLNRCKKTTG